MRLRLIELRLKDRLFGAPPIADIGSLRTTQTDAVFVDAPLTS